MSDTDPTNTERDDDSGSDRDAASSSSTAGSTPDPAATDHPTGDAQAAENEENELPG